MGSLAPSAIAARPNFHSELLRYMHFHPKDSHCSWPTAALLDAHPLLLLHKYGCPNGTHWYAPTAAAQGGHF
jgi:hypothetical protein